jgi:hypothetical protein
MMLFIVVVLLVLWTRSYLKFRHQQSNSEYFLDCMLNNPKAKVGKNYLLRLGCAFMEAQRYESAYRCFELFRNSYEYDPIGMKDTLDDNMAFCRNPIPWMHGPKDLNGSWWHNFLLVRFGKKRWNMLTEDDYLLANSWIRKKRRENE